MVMEVSDSDFYVAKLRRTPPAIHPEQLHIGSRHTDWCECIVWILQQSTRNSSMFFPQEVVQEQSRARLRLSSASTRNKGNGKGKEQRIERDKEETGEKGREEAAVTG